MPEQHDTNAATHHEEVAHFQVDSALLRELGERLVSAPHIALGELVKNAYDADATACEVQVLDDEIIITDNGHGMDRTEFLTFWMTIGTTHKQRLTTSRTLKRPVTGSKGVGRLAAQFLAHELELVTVSNNTPREQLTAHVNWDEAVEAGQLTRAEAKFAVSERQTTFPGKSAAGTTITLRRLKHSWTPAQLQQLARQLWILQPPLANRYSKTSVESDDPSVFEVRLVGRGTKETETFRQQMNAAIENWIAVIEGEIRREKGQPVVSTSVRFRDGNVFSETFPTLGHVQDAKWQIRIYDLSGRQKGGVSVEDARAYFRKFGGVMMYDAGFRLPYYGADQDWLHIEVDHAHRLTASRLLPKSMHVPRALNDLPTQSRIFGVVHINTGIEAARSARTQHESGDYLKIQVSRDRLVANSAFDELRDAVRISLDFYAIRKRIRDSQKIETQRAEEPSFEKVDRVREVLAEARSVIPNDVWVAVSREIDDFDAARSAEETARESEQALLAPIASAGMAALALEHETQKELTKAEKLLGDLRRAKHDPARVDLVASHLEDWLVRLRQIRRIFGPLLDESDREDVERLLALPTLEDIAHNVRALIGKADISVGESNGQSKLYLPAATYSEWHALFQNVIINAANALLDESAPRIAIEVGIEGSRAFVRVSDNGVGIDPSTSEELFEPFARHSSISNERKRLGLGGTGLGLTIVRMIAENRRCRTRFVSPTGGWKTTFELSWRADK
ncbi:ATP-binding protein [Maricaulis maris]|uniref:ATP-binding protein n=1 Tax=Maricaulis maris TaxID=74318 RepID=UPI003A8CCC90